MKLFLKQLFKRLITKIFSLSFITWCIVTDLYYINGQLIDMNFLIFTGAIIGIKTFDPKRMKIVEKKEDDNVK